jgi:hypothetical protein
LVRNLHVQLDDRLFKELKMKCASQEVKVSQVVRELIERWVRGEGHA